jgi:two-component system chemotaxis response regulator CheB
MRRDIVVLGASAGGVEALRTTFANLPGDLPAAVLVVLHVPAYGGSVLPAILDRAGPLPARHAAPGDPLVAGQALVAPPDQHLVIEDGLVSLSRGPRENGHRPAVDVLFRTAAQAEGARVIGVVLSGVLDDGTAGAVAIRSRGGAVIVQDPRDALYPAMPLSAIEHVSPDQVASAAEMGGLIDAMCRVDIAGTEPEASSLMRIEADLAKMDGDAMNDPVRPGVPSGFSCPDCAGTLFEIRDSGLVRYRCRVGHAWSPESLLGEQALQLDGALWMALRSLEEKAALARELGHRATERGNPLTAHRFHEQAEEATRAATLIRSLLQSHIAPTRQRVEGT